MKRLFCLALTLFTLSCNSDYSPLEREEEVDDTYEDSYDQSDIHSGKDVLPDDLDSGVTEQ